MADRKYFTSASGALAAWRKLDPGDEASVMRVVKHLEERLGPVHSPYIGQSGNVVGMSFGASPLVDLYVHPLHLDVHPEAAARAGGLAALRSAFPGFTSGPEQRSGYARLTFPKFRSGERSTSDRRIDESVHCGVRQPSGSECLYCGLVVGED